MTEKEKGSRPPGTATSKDSGLPRRYTLQGTIGEGGVGRVYLGFDRKIGRKVAVKEIHLNVSGEKKKGLERRFVREAKITGQLEHPGIVPVYEVGRKTDGDVYYVMKYVRGRTLGDAVRASRAEAPEEALRNRLKLLDKLLAVCDAMGFAHSRGIVHRDLKPQNIVLGAFGETIILDWGIARVARSKEEEGGVLEPEKVLKSLSQDEELTSQGEILGTPAFMAPEQVDSRFGSVDRRSDVYALGSILYVLLTGETPYQRTEGLPSLIFALTGDEPSPSPEAVNKDIPPELAAICRRAMQKDKEKRFANAMELAEELRAYRDGRLVSVYAYSRSELFRRFVARNKAIILATLFIVAAIVIGAGLSVNFGIKANRAQKQATAAKQRALEARRVAVRAKDRAEAALSEVMNKADSAFLLSKYITGNLHAYFNTLSREMEEMASGLADLKQVSGPSAAPYLKVLYDTHQEARCFFTVSTAGRILRVYPDSAGYFSRASFPQGQEALIHFSRNKGACFNAIKLLGYYQGFIVQVPVIRKGKVTGLLGSIIRTENMMPKVYGTRPMGNRSTKLMCLQRNGDIFFNEDITEVGKNPLTSGTYHQFPELVHFFRRVMAERNGVGHYKYHETRNEYEGGHRRVINQVAAWTTFVLSDTIQWKVVGYEPYYITEE
jgi:serine/threonine protein kinase